MLSLPSASHLPLPDILRRVAMPFFLFALVLAGLLTLSWYLLLPHFTRLEVGGNTYNIRSLQGEVSAMKASILSFDERRRELVRPARPEHYSALLKEKMDAPSPLALRASVETIALSLVPDTPNAVTLTAFRFDSREGILTVEGDVRNVGPRSMTVLAQLVESLSELPDIADVRSPSFTREEDPVLGQHSPFSIRLTLK